MTFIWHDVAVKWKIRAVRLMYEKKMEEYNVEVLLLLSGHVSCLNVEQ